MSFEDQKCVLCESQNVFKVPHISISEATPRSSTKIRTGKIVDDYIEETREIIKKEKSDLRKREL